MKLRPDDLPPLVAGSLQGDHVFVTTLSDNLRVVAPDLSDADLDAVAERVGLAEWVRSLPRGWSTQAALYHRARCNQAARRGEYLPAMEETKRP